MTPLEAVIGILNREAQMFEKLTDALRSGLTSIENRYFEKTPPGTPLPHAFTDECSVEELFLLDAAEIMLAGLWHWVERSLKKISLLSLSNATQQDKRRIARSNFSALSLDLSLKQCADYPNINLLRLLVNSWKHNPNAPSAELLADLGIQSLRRNEYDDPMALLGSDAVTERLFQRTKKELELTQDYLAALSIPVAFKVIALRFLVEATTHSQPKVTPDLNWWGLKRNSFL